MSKQDSCRVNGYVFDLEKLKKIIPPSYPGDVERFIRSNFEFCKQYGVETST